MEVQNKNKPPWGSFVAIAFIFFSTGLFLGFKGQPEILLVRGLENKEQPSRVNADFSHFWKVWNLIDEKYVPPQINEDANVSNQEKVWGAIKGMVRSLGDPSTIFLSPPELEVFEREISGNFEGVGIEIGVRDNALTVIAPLKNTPAFKAGVKAGDVILKIDDKETGNLSIEEAISLIRGKRGTSVVLTLSREGVREPVVVTVIRDVIDIPALETEQLDDVFVIRLYNFSAISSDLFRMALREFVSTGGSKLILDLRGNPGGFLESSIDMASWFLPAGKAIVRENFGGRQEDVVYRSKGYNIFNPNTLKMAILIDGGSASASEILAGALSEHGVATIIGSQSFGKGSVQELVRVTSDTSLKVTVARWVTPEGRSISLEGLKPDIEVEFTEEDFKNGRDPVLEKALEMLK